jgi:hypothetical protein
VFKAPKGFTPVQRVSWYVGLVIAFVLMLTVLALGFRGMVAVWQWVLGI